MNTTKYPSQFLSYLLKEKNRKEGLTEAASLQPHELNGFIYAAFVNIYFSALMCSAAGHALSVMTNLFLVA